MHKLFPLMSLFLLTLTIACTETVYHTQGEETKSYLRIDSMSASNIYIDAIIIGHNNNAQNIINISGEGIYNTEGIMDALNMININNLSTNVADYINLSCMPFSNSTVTTISESCLDSPCDNATFAILKPQGYLELSLNTPLETGDTIYIVTASFVPSNETPNTYACKYMNLNVSMMVQYRDNTLSNNWYTLGTGSVYFNVTLP